jgi:hypothetical protein
VSLDNGIAALLRTLIFFLAFVTQYFMWKKASVKTPLLLAGV